MTTIEQSICDAIDIIVEKAISEANYDKTVMATIVTCVDETIGKYKCKYQDSTFYAYSGSSEITYTAGSSVYVLIPGNDMSQDKTILGTTKKLGINYVVTAEGDDAYEVTGTNVLTSSGTFEMSSYKEGTYVKVLYSKDYSSSQNLIDLDTTAVKEYLSNSECIICGGVVRTELPVEQQYRGNYGIIFALDFFDNTENNTVTRYYTVDVDNMTGNPYKLIYDTRQYGIFDIDAENFIEVNSISIFCYDFPNSLPDNECVSDIFISELELSGANRLSDDDISNYSLTFVTSKGTYFTESSLDSDTLTIEAQVRVKSKVIDNDSQELPFYWGTEHVGVTSQSLNYCKYLGQGWKCLNDYNIIEAVEDSDDPIVEWVPASYKITIKKTDIVAKEVKYKCAVVYDGTVITHTITIKNLGSNYNITIESDCGTQFYFDIGYPTLTCLVNGVSNSMYTYSWAVTNNVGTFESIAETPDLNSDYASLLAEYNQLSADIANESKTYAANATKLAGLESSLAEYDTITRVDGNTIYHLNVNTITSFSTYQCTIYYGDLYIGTTSITLLNTLEVEGTYSLVINNGTYAYKYNESGISPASGAVDSPIDIMALTFTIYDNLGQAIDDDIARHCDIAWTVPTANTLLEIPSSYSPSSIDSVNNTATYSNLMSFSYAIADRYDVTKTKNNIYLTVNYKGTSLSAKTNLTFVKEGESGTNGTEFTCKIVPNVASGDIPKYWIITEDANGSYSHNFTPVNSGKYLKVQFYHNENLILDSVSSATSTEGKTATITWEILANKYTASVSDYTSLSVNSSTGTFSYSGYNNNHPAHIVKVTVVYDGVTYYATFPVITVKLSNNNYKAVLKEGTGFQYATYTSDGLSPKYDNTNPFEITVTQSIDGFWEDVSTKTSSTYVLTYAWSYLGRIYEDKAWVSDTHLTDRYVTTTLASNQQPVKPVDSYDGQCVTNAVQCIISHTGTEVARIHIPVHLMLNKYGLSYINSWDGNSVEIEEDGGFILAPQVGAGIKNSDNSFTGVLIGAVKESGSSNTETGLFGYAAGVRSIFLDASTGKAEFGANGKGQIIIDPSSNKAQIYSGNYSESAGTGMIIDLTTPYIKFGSGNFSVDADGYLIAKGGGSIAGWNIDDTSLWTGSSKSNSASIILSSSDITERTTVNGQTDKNLRILINNNFGINSSGKFYAASGVIGNGSNKITLDKSTASDSYSAIYSGSKSSFDATSSGFYIGTDGIALGSYSTTNGHSAFQVTNAGQMIASSGYIGNGSRGWAIQSTYLVNGDKTAYNDTSNSGVYLGTSGIGLGTYFYVSSAGYLYSKSGTIGGWTIGTNTLSAGNIILNGETGSISGGSTYSWSISSNGAANFNYLTASNGGTIGGWTIGSSYLRSTNSNVTLNANGTITGPTWSITSAGVATFKNVYITNDSSTNTSMNWGNFSVDTSGNLNATNAKFSGTVSGSTISGGTISSATITGGSINIGSGVFTVDSSGNMTATSGTFKGVLNCYKGNYYLKMGVDTSNPEVSGLNIGTYGINVNGNSGWGGSTGTTITFINAIQAPTLAVSFTKGTLEVSVNSITIQVTINYQYRQMTITSGIVTGMTSATGGSVSAAKTGYES